jgi:hypothetical protein
MQLNITQIGQDIVQVTTPIALALLAYRQTTIEKAISEIKDNIKEIRNMFIGHLEK